MSSAKDVKNAYPVPDAIFEQHSAWLATSGAGKTTAVKGGVERMLARGERVVIVDPTGVWWGLRFLADGRRTSPYEVVIFGREHADLPLEDGSGEAIARALGTSSTSAILSLKGMRVAARTRFITDFFEELVANNRGILNLMIDEVHLFAPQSGGTGLTPAMLHATNNLVSTGRASGLRIAMISQRPAKVHKDSLTQAKTLVALQCSHVLDQRPVRDWLSTTVAEKDKRQEIMLSLAGLPTGSGWLSAPQLGLLERIDFPMIATFDSSRPGVEEIPLKPLDVAALRESLRATSCASEPPADRSKKESGGSAGRPVGADDLAAAEQRGYERGFVEGEALGQKRGAAAGWRAATTCLQRDLDGFMSLVGSPADHEDGETEVARALGLAAWPPSVGKASKPASSPRKSSFDEKNREDRAERVANHDSSPLNSAGQKMLAVLDTNPPVRRSWQQIATLAGLKARGGHFNAGRKGLVDAGIVDVAGDLVAIAAPSPGAKPEIRDPAAIVETWSRVLSGAAPKILRALFAEPADADGRRGQHRGILAHDLGMQPRGGHWNAAWKELRDNGLVRAEGDVAWLSDLFSE